MKTNSFIYDHSFRNSFLVHGRVLWTNDLDPENSRNITHNRMKKSATCFGTRTIELNPCDGAICGSTCNHRGWRIFHNEEFRSWALTHANRRTEKHDKSNRPFSRLCENASKKLDALHKIP